MLRLMTVALVGLVAAGAVRGQQPANTGRGNKPYEPTTATPKKSLLEETLEAAAKSNPDLRVALAKLAEADAEVARTRLRVIQKVVAAYQEVDKLREPLAKAEDTIKQAVAQFSRGEQDPKVIEMRQKLADYKAKLAAAEAELDYLVGKPAAKQAPGTTSARTSSQYLLQHLYDAQGNQDAARYYDALGYQDPARFYYSLSGRGVAGPTADRLRQALGRRVTVSFKDATAREALEALRKEADGLHIQAPAKGEAWNEKVTATLSDVPFGAALQLLEDVLAGHRIVVREYGLFIVPQEKVPPGATLLGDFWRDAVKSAPPAPSTTSGTRK